MDELICTDCGKSFNYRQNSNAHVKAKHLGDNWKCSCQLCSFSAGYKCNLMSHVKAKHDGTVSHSRVKCPLCVTEHETKYEMVQHYIKDHDIRVTNENIEFANEQEFYDWKRKIEKEQICEYVTWRSKYVRKGDSCARMLYICHRDGELKSKRKNIRHQKILGSNKISGHCPSKIEVTFHPSGKVIVSFCKTHVGHQGELGRLRLSESERLAIAQNIAMKISFNDILDDIRKSISDSDIERVHLVTRKDLHNIAQEYNLKSEAIRHSNDYASVESWIREMEVRGGVVRFYKAQGIPSATHS